MKFIIHTFLVLSLLIAGGCSNQGNTEEQKIMISAAASLSGVLSQIASAFESENVNTTLTLNYGASGKLAQQILQGAPVDVFLSADQKLMDKLSEQDMIIQDTRANFTKNKLVLVANESSNLSLESLENLTSIDLDQIAIGNPESVPVGSYAKQALTALGIWEDLDDQLVYAKDVRQVLTYVESGNTDIGFVYASDLERSKMVEEVTKINTGLYESIDYPAAVIASSETKEKAKAFVEFLKTEEARSILAKYGFGS